MNDLIQKALKNIKTENLLLRIPKKEDIHAVLSIEGNPDTNKFRPSGPMKDLDEAEETLKEWRNNWFIDGYGYWAVTLPSSLEVIGFGGIRKEQWQGLGILNLYYRFAPKAWGHGYATEVGQTAVQMGNAYLPDLPVVARIRPVNKPSIRVAEKIGLQHRPELDSREHMAFVSK